MLQVARQDNDLGYLLEDVTADGANNFLVDQLVGFLESLSKVSVGFIFEHCELSSLGIASVEPSKAGPFATDPSVHLLTILKVAKGYRRP